MVKLNVKFKNMLLHYMLCGCCPRFCFPCKSLLFTPNPGLYMPMYPCSPPNGLMFTTILSYGLVTLSAITSVCRGVGGRKTRGLYILMVADVCDAILAQYIYCAKLNPDSYTQLGSQVYMRLGARAVQRTWEYDLVTVIEIRPLTQPLTCEMSSSIFSAMSQLKVAITTSASLPIITSTNRTNREKCFRWS